MSALGQRLSGRAGLLLWAAGLGAITAEALGIREGMTIASARATLAAAVSSGQLVRHRPLVGQPSLYTVTQAGLRMLGLSGLRLTSVSPGNARHQIVCAQVAAMLERCYPDHLVLGERALREYERRIGIPLAGTVLAYAGTAQAIHRADMALLSSNGERARPIVVEVELTVKAPHRLASICRAWARSRHIDGALYVASPEVERALERAIAAVSAGSRVAVIPLESLAERSSSLAQVNCIPSDS